MGIGIVLIVCAVVGLVLGGIGALVLRFTSAALTQGAQRSRRRLIVVTSLFPFICLGWAGAVFIFQALINESVFHRDAGLGDTWTCPLPNGYALLMVDDADEGIVYNLKTQSGSGITAQDDAVDGVRNLQLASKYIFGGCDTKWFDHLTSGDGKVDSYFVLDTQLGKHTNLSSYEALRGNAHELGFTLNLEPIATVYRRNRVGWFDVLAGLLLFIPPLTALILLIRWTIRVHKTRGELWSA